MTSKRPRYTYMLYIMRVADVLTVDDHVFFSDTLNTRAFEFKLTYVKIQCDQNNNSAALQNIYKLCIYLFQKIIRIRK